MKKKIQIPHISHWTILVQSSLICGLLAALIFALGHRRIEPIPLSPIPLRFNSINAYDYMRHLSKNYPNRVTWSDNRKKAGEWLKSELKSMGYSPKSIYFSEVIAGKQYTDLENIYVEKKGSRHPDEIIVAMAHYDITDTTVEGAMDDGSGVGIVLELARLFSTESTDRTILFLLTDSEEYGAFWGATAFVNSYEKADKIIATTNFDFVTPEKQTKILTLCDGLKTGFTPLWLREIALNSLRSLNNIEALDLDGPTEFIERAMQIPPADHGPFLAAGIPAFNWVGQTDHFARIMTHYHHTKYDVAEALSVDSFTPFGIGAERVIRTIDALPRIPTDFRDSSYWKISPRYYLPGWAVTLLHILAFIPFLVSSISLFRHTLRNASRKVLFPVFLSELKIMGILLGSLLVGYALILLLPALKLITLYENFPATQKSHILYSPNFLIILFVILSIVATYLLLNRIFVKSHDTLSQKNIRHALHSGLLAFIIFLAFLKNSYLAVLLLLPPAYFWTAIREREKAHGKALNGLLILGGTISLLATAVVLTTVFHVGVVYWYLFLAASYGLISAYAAVLFFMSLTVMIRLFRSFVL